MGTVIDTPDGIAFFRLASLARALELEAKGLRMSSRFSALAVAKGQFGYTGSRAKITAAVRADVNRILALREAGENPVEHVAVLAHDAAKIERARRTSEIADRLIEGTKADGIDGEVTHY